MIPCRWKPIEDPGGKCLWNETLKGNDLFRYALWKATAQEGGYGALMEPLLHGCQ